ncbi:MAG: Serine/threonine protein kinaselike protein [Actinoallomurus sp.]|nr:Serine/threonine protein kinaselike protein [Actinoallomurus sp.]
MDRNWTVPGYRHVRTLGEGSSGTVVLAVHEATGAPAAIKYLSDQLRSDQIFLNRFRSEAQLMSELDDPNLVRFYEYVEAPGAAALVMELVDGVTLSRLITSEGGTGPEAALLVLKGSLRGLGAAHAVGVVHRDYKPGNVLVRDDGVSKLADFGIAVRAGDEVTASGTPAYMAPEQWSSGTVSTATDVYAATAVFYECLTGERPYPVKGLWALAAAHRLDPIPVERVPEPLRDLVAHGLAKDFADRPPSADAFLAELEDVALAAYGPGWEERGRVRLAALAALLAALLPMARQLPTADTALGLTRLGRKRLAVAGGVVVGALVAGGGGGYVLAGVHHRLGANSAATSTPSAAIEPSTAPVPADTPSPGGSGGVPPAPSTTPPATGPPAGGPPTPDPTPSSGTTGPGTVIPSPTPRSTPTPTTVSRLHVTFFTLRQGNATATVGFTVHGPGKVTVSAVFSPTPTAAAGTAFRAAGDPDPQTVSGRGHHEVTFTHDFGTRQCPASAHVTVTTSPPGGAAESDAKESQPCEVVGKTNG